MFSLKKMGLGAKVALCSVMVALTGGVENVYAQAAGGVDGSALLEAGSTAGKNLISSLVRFLQIGLGIAALVTLVVVIYNLFKQEREAATKLIWWVVGLAVGFGLMTALTSIINTI